MSNRIVSFVDQSQLRVIDRIDTLQEMIRQCRKSNTALSKLDLSQLDLENLDMSELELSDIVFNRYDVTNPHHKTIRNISFRGSRLSRVSFAHCRLICCNFDRADQTLREAAKRNNEAYTPLPNPNTELREVDFFMCVWERCRLRKTIIEVADFRYSQFTDCSLGGCRIHLGDFYMTAFKGTTNFMASLFMSCSITNATFDHDCIRIKGIEQLAQEHYEEYSTMLIGHPKWYKQNPCGGYSHQNEGEDKGYTAQSRSFAHREASEVYAHLSGFYAGRGLFKDSNMAYERAKRNEALAAYYDMRWQWQQLTGAVLLPEEERQSLGQAVIKIGKDLLRLLNFALCWILGFGYKLKNVIICFILLVIGYSLLFHWKAAEELPWQTELAYSLNNTIGSFDAFIMVVGAWLSSLQTTIGILLVGFAGFVIANRVRNNY